MSFLRGLFGIGPKGPFASPAYVNKDKAPGHTSLLEAHHKKGWFLRFMNPLSFFFGPGFLWFVLAVIGYVAVPYDMEAQKTKNFEMQYVFERVMLHCAIYHVYTMFWHFTLYTLGWGQRKFNPGNDGPTLARLFHNMWFGTLGAVQSGAWDALFGFIYAHGKLSYASDADVAASPLLLVVTVFGAVAAQWWRDVHFYFVHRMIHFRFLYKYVHSVHHRNTDVEPYAGLSMHPIEHLYYYSCAPVMMFFGFSPFVAYFSLIHAIIAPAAGHSGFEDNLQSDIFHFLHHCKFECNYGTVGIPFDQYFGTLRDKFGDDIYAGGGDNMEDVDTKKPTQRTYLSGGLYPLQGFWQTTDRALFDAITCIALPGMLLSALSDRYTVNATLPEATLDMQAHMVAFMVTWGPVLVSILFWYFTDNQSWKWPFHKDPLFGSLGVNFGVAILISVIPVYPAVYLALM